LIEDLCNVDEYGYVPHTIHILDWGVDLDVPL
jgi:hypothetical protein